MFKLGKQMNRILAQTFLCWISLFPLQSASAVSIDWTFISEPGNTADVNGVGAVAYSYNIGTYDVTNNQYVDFLNAKDPTGANTLGLYCGNPNPLVTPSGIAFDSAQPYGSKYSSVVGRGNQPVTLVS